MKKIIKNNGTGIALLVLVIILTILEPVFFTPRNLTNLIRQVTIIGIISVGMTFVILIAGIDLSVGSIAGLAAIVVTLMMQAGFPVWLAIFATILLIGGGIGLFNGFMVSKFEIHPFITTLGIMTIARGAALTLSGGSSVPVTKASFSSIGAGYIDKFPSLSILVIVFIIGLVMIFKRKSQKKKYNIETSLSELIAKVFLLLIVFLISIYIFIGYSGIPNPVIIYSVVVFWGIYLLRKTRFGRKLYAIGGNEEVARLSGIEIFKTKIIVYTTIAILSSVSGIILASRLNSATPNLGNLFELDAIAAVIIGGTSFFGGIGTVTGTIIGALIIGVIGNGMSLLGMPTFYQMMVQGVIIILAVLLDVINRKKHA